MVGIALVVNVTKLVVVVDSLGEVVNVVESLAVVVVVVVGTRTDVVVTVPPPHPIRLEPTAMSSYQNVLVSPP